MGESFNIRRKLDEDEDFVDLRRFDYSVRKALERYPDGLPDHLIAQALCISEEHLSTQYQAIVLQLRMLMKVDDV